MTLQNHEMMLLHGPAVAYSIFSEEHSAGLNVSAKAYWAENTFL